MRPREAFGQRVGLAGVDNRAVNKKAIEALIKCGAFGSTGDSRKGMLAMLEQACEHAFLTKTEGKRLMESEQDLDRLRGLPEFKALQARMGAK